MQLAEEYTTAEAGKAKPQSAVDSITVETPQFSVNTTTGNSNSRTMKAAGLHRISAAADCHNHQTSDNWEIFSFLVGYYQIFVSTFGKIAKPFIDMLKKGEFTRSKEQPLGYFLEVFIQD